MTGEKGGLLAGLRAEALKSRHAAPVRLAVLMALPLPLLGAMPYRGVDWLQCIRQSDEGRMT